MNDSWTGMVHEQIHEQIHESFIKKFMNYTWTGHELQMDKRVHEL